MYHNDNSNCLGWGTGAAAILGAAAGFWAGRTSGPGFGPNAYGYGYGAPVAGAALAADYGLAGAGRTYYQQGIQTGQTLAGIDYISQKVTADAQNTRQAIDALQSSMSNQFQAVQNQFNALAQQKIQDLQNQVTALRTQQVVSTNACATNLQLTSLNDKLSSIVTGCGVRSYPGCPPPPNPCGCNGFVAAVS